MNSLNTNHLQTLLELSLKYDDEEKFAEKWEHLLLGMNPNINWPFIRENIWLFNKPTMFAARNIITWNIILDNLDINWDFDYISQNENITWDIITKYPNPANLFPEVKPVEPEVIYDNSDTDEYEDLEDDSEDDSEDEYVIKYDPNKIKVWDPVVLSFNENITWDIVKNNPNINWSSNITELPDITLDIVKNNPEYNWNMEILSASKNITWDIVKEHPEYENPDDNDEYTPMIKNAAYWDYDNLSANPNITWDIIRDNLIRPDGSVIPWNYEKLIHENKNITAEIVINNPKVNDIIIPWNHQLLSSMSDITWDMVVNNPQIKWNYTWLSCNRTITWDIVKENLDKPWDWGLLSLNSSTTWDIVRDNQVFSRMLIPWDYAVLSMNINITCDIIEANPDKPWNYKLMSRNPNLTWKFVWKNWNKNWDYKELTNNLFNLHPALRNRNLRKKYFDKWRSYAGYRAYYRNLYYCVIHEMKMRFRDKNRC